MEFVFLNDADKENYKDKLFNLLKDADDEFVPPLSQRSSTTQKNLSGGKKSDDGIKLYFDEMMKQKIMIAKEDDVLGFVSFRENFENDVVDEKPNIYLSTLTVSKDGRGRGITKSMYECLFEEYKNSYVFTRTWSTNYAHIKILSKFNFDVIKVLKDDRGKGIDTVYFRKNRE